MVLKWVRTSWRGWQGIFNFQKLIQLGQEDEAGDCHVEENFEMLHLSLGLKDTMSKSKSVDDGWLKKMIQCLANSIQC